MPTQIPDNATGYVDGKTIVGSGRLESPFTAASSLVVFGLKLGNFVAASGRLYALRGNNHELAPVATLPLAASVGNGALVGLLVRANPGVGPWWDVATQGADVIVNGTFPGDLGGYIEYISDGIDSWYARAQVQP